VDITEVVKRTGVPASTLRFYEEKRLIQSTGRRGLHRVFEPVVLEQLALIALTSESLVWSPDGTKIAYAP